MNCTRCGVVWCPGEATVCSKCADGATSSSAGGSPPPMPSPDDFVGRMIPTGNKPSLIGYYMAFGAWLPVLGPILAVVAVIYGVKGVKLAKAYPEVRGGCHAWFAIVGGIGLGLLGVLGTVGIFAAFSAAKR